MKTPVIASSTIAALAALSSSASLSAQTLSGGWVFGGSSAGHIVSSGASASGFTLGSTADTSNVTATTYFAAGTSPITLAVGESLSLSFDVTFNFKNPSGDAFRFGLFNTGNSQTTGNNYTVAGNSAWTGYSIWLPSSSTTTDMVLYDRTATNNVVLAGGANTSLGSADVTAGQTGNNTYTNVNLVIERLSGTSVSISASFNGVEITNALDSTNAVFSFDALHFFGRGSALTTSSGNQGNFTVSNLSLASIPEPSSFAALAGLVVLGGCLTRRSRRGL